MSVLFTVDRWAAWAPGLVQHEDWLKWFEQPSAITAEAMPALSEVAPMMRRRIELLGRMALQAAYWTSSELPPCPVVFASRWGDSTRSLSLLSQLAGGEPLSPTAFSMSVHNAIGALFSIARQDAGNYTAVASGTETVEAGFCEALGMLADGSQAVMVVYYDEPLPEPFRVFNDEDTFPHAWACRVVPAAGRGISLTASSANQGLADEARDTAALGADLAALRFLTSHQAKHTHCVGQRCWQWVRHG